MGLTGSRALVIVTLLVGALLAAGCVATAPDGKPPAGGFFPLRPVGALPSLPDDQQAAAMVHRSSWEPRPENTAANHTVPTSGFPPPGYAGMLDGQAVFGRITGNFTGTTDEIIQWAAAKWGLPDELIRSEAVVESNWYQNLKDAAGKPAEGRGYGDFGHCDGSLPGDPYGPDGPSSFGLLQVKWCALTDSSAPGSGGWPWTERSTAYAVDTYAAVIRGCYEGSDVWLDNGYHGGDLWGCVGRWYSGAWYSSAAQGYIAKVQQADRSKDWLHW
jgi:hypothetical protein